jgi:glucokinase
VRILAGDIGGTNARLGLFEPSELRRPLQMETYASGAFASFREVVQRFQLHCEVAIDAICIGVAGPVLDGRSATVNLSWAVDGAELAEQLGTERVWVINDLEATAYGVPLLREGDLAQLNGGNASAANNMAVIAAGTGLGEAGLYWDGTVHRPFATEGGHASFAPADEVDAALLSWLQGELGHVSWERLVSGMGIVNIYRFLRDSGRFPAEAWEGEAMAGVDAAAQIAQAAQSHRSALCVATMQRFFRLYGAEAGNLALKMKAIGGVFLGGGIAAKNLAGLRAGEFMQAFFDKGRMRPLLEATPVHVITNEFTAIYGAAHCAYLRAIG